MTFKEYHKEIERRCGKSVPVHIVRAYWTYAYTVDQAVRSIMDTDKLNYSPDDIEHNDLDPDNEAGY